MLFRLVGQYFKDLRKFPEIAPVTFIVIAASTTATVFMPWKLTHTPDVVYNPKNSYSWEGYAGGSDPHAAVLKKFGA